MHKHVKVMAKTELIKRVLSLLIISTFLSLIGYAKKEVPTKFIITASSDELKSTVFTPHMEKEIVEDTNLIYCSTFQLAWNELRDSILIDSLPDAPEVLKMLDKRLSTKEDISEDDYLVMTGYESKGIIEKIKRQLKRKFGYKSALLYTEEIYGVVAYAFLFKSLMFKEEFEGLRPTYFYSNEEPTKVKCFGIKKISLSKEKHKLLRKQVSILDYKNDNDFIISLSSTSPDDEIILAKISPEKTLLETIESIEGRIKSAHPTLLKKDEILKIPKLDFDITHSYDEITSYLSRLARGPAKAIQNICFRLNKKGAILKSEALIRYKGRKHVPKRPRMFIFNEPFLIYLKEKTGKYPYFAMWVDNPELLLKANRGEIEQDKK